MNKSILLIGYHGKDNLGDDIFRRVLLGAINESTVTKTVKILTAKGGRIDDAQYLGLTIQAIVSPRWLPGRLRWFTVFYHSLRSSGILFGAGSLFIRQPFREIFWMLKVRKLFSFTAFPIVASGVSVGPFDNEADRDKCFKLLREFDHILLRDFDSMKRLEESGGINSLQGFDLALGFSELPVSAPPESGKKVIGLSVTKRAFPDWKDPAGSFKKFCTCIIESSSGKKDGLVFRIIVACMDSGDGDSELSSLLIEELKSAGFATETVEHRDSSLDTTLSEIGSCSGLIAARMHVGIMGLLYRVPIIQISYEEKIRSFYARHDLSMDYLFDSDNVSSDLLSTSIAVLLSDEHHSFPSFSDHQIAEYKQSVNEQIKKNIQILS